MRRIGLRVDDGLFLKMQSHKASIQEKLKLPELTWESYIQHLFGFYQEQKVRK